MATFAKRISFSKKNHPSCIKEIYLSTSLDKSLHNYNRYIFPAKEQIIPISYNEFFTVFPQIFIGNRMSNRTQQIQTKGIPKITVKKGCTILFNNFIVKGIETVIIG